MSTILYTTEYPNDLSPGDLGALINILPRDLKQKALRFHRWQDAYGCIFGKLLLKIALRKMNFPGDLNSIQYSSQKKPFLPDGPHFNISHSANRVVCAVNMDRRVGVDIEYVADKILVDDYRNLFTSAEWEAICNRTSPKIQFYDFWTAKESLIKADGRGFGISLQEVDVSAAGPVLLGGKSWAIVRLPNFNGYSGHVAVEIPSGTGDPYFFSIPSEIYTKIEVCELSPAGILDVVGR
jgi:4'-phosphopantetheinyl transferase